MVAVRKMRSYKVEPTACSRVRVRKACQRCKVKKTRCNGAFPCAKCKDADEVCLYRPREQVLSRPKPRGYIELLEQQQTRLSRGLKKMYERLNEAKLWDGPSLGNEPRVLEILAELGCLEPHADEEMNFPTPESQSSPKSENGSDMSFQMSYDHSQGNIFEVGPQTTPLQSEIFNVIDWDCAVDRTPLPIDVPGPETERPTQSPSSSYYGRSLKEYSARMMEVQAQQARLAARPTSVTGSRSH